jgi:hypothetical protein
MTIENQEALLKVVLRQNPDATVGQFAAAIRQQEWLSQDFQKTCNMSNLRETGAIKIKP